MYFNYATPEERNYFSEPSCNNYGGNGLVYRKIFGKHESKIKIETKLQCFYSLHWSDNTYRPRINTQVEEFTGNKGLKGTER